MIPEAPRPDLPAALGYRLPAEWEPHAATWIAWPHNRDDWPGKFGPIPWVYVEIVRHLSRVERVNILVEGRKARQRAAQQLADGGANLENVHFVKGRTDRVWTRDYAPTFLVNERADADPVALIDWKFNGWAKYKNHRLDDRIPRKLARRLGLRRWKPEVTVGGEPRRLVLEGGAIDTNGRGTLLTTEECLLSPIQARNPGLSREDLERVLADYLGIRQVIWLGRGIAGDDTHGHVDDITRFVGPRTVVTVVEDDPTDLNYEPLQENLERLRSARDQDGQLLEVVPLPMPDPVVFQGQRLPASYANFYIANGLVLVPTFNDPADREALTILASLFSDRQVVGIHCVDLIWGLGALHCMTHEQPAAPVGTREPRAEEAREDPRAVSFSVSGLAEDPPPDPLPRERGAETDSPLPWELSRKHIR
ncbi:MAG: agmatine deiminase family protein, partial [Isosphaeraceae bacterium]|nr:agmatine deiminase family protein [Isosphaeraceae bacterium]